MNKLPLYQQAPQASVANVTPLVRDDNCARCELHIGARNRCLQPEGAPGGIYVLMDAPTSIDDRSKRPYVSALGRFVRGMIAKHWKGNVALDYAARCTLGARKQKDIKEKFFDACMPYTAQVLSVVRPQRVITIGPWAAYGLLGRRPQVHALRRGYNWYIDEELFPDAEAWIPVYFMPSVDHVMHNRFESKAFEEDLQWALTAPIPDHTIYAATRSEVLTVADAEVACKLLRDAHAVVFDTETSGIMHNADFRVDELTCWPLGSTHGYTWPRAAIDDNEVCAPLRRLLADNSIKKIGHGLAYDVRAVRCDPALAVDIGEGAYGDTRLWRKLVEGDVTAKLEVAAELVGMGGHKLEAQDALDGIKTDLSKLAGEPYLKPLKPLKNGKLRVRPPYVPSTLIANGWNGVEQHILDNIHTGAAETMSYAYRYMQPAVRGRYNARDAFSTALLVGNLYPRIARKSNLMRLWTEVTQPASVALARMTHHGVRVDRGAVEMFETYLLQRIAIVEARMRKYGDINFNSTDQLAALLYNKLRLPCTERSKLTNAPSTGADALEGLAGKHPIIADIIEHRMLSKMCGTYATGLKWHIRSDGRIHSSFLLDGASCMPAGELVLTARGYIPVEDVEIGDTVLSHTGVPRKVAECSVHAPSAIYRVTLRSGQVLRTTGNHLYRSCDGWVRADELQVGTVVTVHSGTEVWRKVADWPYEVSSWGRVRTMFAGNNTPAGHMLAQQRKGEWGHLKVTLVRNRSQVRGPDYRDFPVHRLVMSAFSDDLSEEVGAEVRHANGIAWDNTLRNLSWGSSRDNRADAVKHGSMLQREFSALSDADVLMIRSTLRPPRYGAGRWDKTAAVSDSAFVTMFCVTREYIRDVRNGKRMKPAPIEGKRASFYTDKVVSVAIDSAAVTYGLTVEVDHSHVTGGVVTHNTGRMSSADPNLENIPSVDNDDVEARALAMLLRACFLPSKGKLLVEVDESQLELRVAASLSRDPVMVAMFEKDEDFHLQTARMIAPAVWKLSAAQFDACTPEQQKAYRRFAKPVNFKIHYAREPEFTLANDLKCTVAEAARVVNAVRGQFKVLTGVMDETLHKARREGGVHIYWQMQPANWRNLYALADTGEHNRARRMNAENSAWNSPVQGTAAHYATASMHPIQRAFDDACMDAEVLLPIHDSILAEVDEHQIDEAVDIMVRTMTGWNSGAVPLVVSVVVGHNWAEMKKYVPGSYGR